MKLIEDFILDGLHSGALTYATKEINLSESNCAICRVYAFAIHDIFDKKKVAKD